MIIILAVMTNNLFSFNKYLLEMTSAVIIVMMMMMIGIFGI